jgi:hypothetical protein
MPPRYRSWQQLLRGGFAFQTAPFASHPLDAQRAVQMVHAALRAGVSTAEINAEATAYLKSENVHPDEVVRQVDRVHRSVQSLLKPLCSSRAWLVTLESTDAPAVVAAVFKAQRSADTVREYMEQHYIDRFYSPYEKLLYARSPRNNPYPAEFASLDGVPWRGRITCGHNPFLYGRLVRKLRVEQTQGQQFAWEELPVPERTK